MNITNAKCTNCGANLQLDASKEAGICQFCGSAFVTEKAINAYNVSNTINVGGGGNTINIVHNYVTQPPQENLLDKFYTVTITRKKNIFMGALVKLNLITEDNTYPFNNGAVVVFQTNKVNNHVEIIENSIFTGLHNYVLDFKMAPRDSEIVIKTANAEYVVSHHNMPKVIMKRHSDYAK